MNISEDRKVVLSALREVPEEITFMLSDAEQDAKIPNRYWFDFPSQWANQTNKDPIIGIRAIYATKTNRYIRYKYEVELILDDVLELDDPPIPRTMDKIEGEIIHWLEGADTIRPVTENFNKYWLEDGTRTHTCTDEQHEWKPWEVQAYYTYDREEKLTYLGFGRGIMEDEHVVIDGYNYKYYVRITPLADDTKALFGTDTYYEGSGKVRIPVWSRYNCMVKSSIAINSKNNILGHTRDNLPIKYYRLTQGIKKFWIELYETRYHDAGVILPKDKRADGTKYMRDDLFIEAIVCFSAQGML